MLKSFHVGSLLVVLPTLKFCKQHHSTTPTGWVQSTQIDAARNCANQSSQIANLRKSFLKVG